MHLDRRELLKGALLAAAAGTLAEQATAPARAEQPADPSPDHRPWPVVDVNVSLFSWPFRRLPHDTPEQLAGKLQSLAITQAWAGSFEGLLHRDLAGVNARLAEACRATPTGLLLPFGSVNPALPDWEEDLRRCHETHRMPGIRLHPNYHGYTLDDPAFARLLHLAAGRGLLVQLAASLEDTRTQHHLVRVADVDLAPLPDLLAKLPAAQVMLLNHTPRGAAHQQLAAATSATFDIARVEGTDGIARLMESATPRRVVFGTHAPFLIPESGLIKVYESQLNEEQIGLLLAGNARRLLA